MSKKKIIIFGASGFVGEHLCKFLIKKGFEVVAFVRSEKKVDFNTKYKNNTNRDKFINNPVFLFFIDLFK